MRYKLFLSVIVFLITFTIFINNAIGDNAKIVVSEIAWMGTKASARDEWVELYNNSDNQVDVTNWVLKTADGGLNIKLAGFIPVKGFYLIERNDDEVVKDTQADLIASFGNGFSNTGEKIELYDFAGQLVDFIDASGGWPQGKASPDYKTMERVDLSGSADLTNWKTNDGAVIKGIDAEDNPILGTPTNSENALNNSQPVLVEPTENNLNANIFISEILPNPQASDKESEFIELYNKNSEPVDLKDWILEDESKTQYKIKAQDFNSTVIPASGYFVIYRKQSNIALNNSGGDSLKLFNAKGDLIDSVVYKDKPDEQISFNRDFSDVSLTPSQWEWSSVLTPGAANIITLPNQPPQASFSFSQDGAKVFFDASDSVDPENNALKYLWDFGDGEKSSEEIVEHTYLKDGKYSVILEISDGVSVTRDSKTVFVEKINSNQSYSDQVIINELLPNPEGQDLANEWIELYNKGNLEVNLEGWQIGDFSVNNKSYIIPPGVKIAPGSFLILKREQTNIALNNNGDGVKLIQPNQNLIDSAVFNEKAQDGFSFNRKPDGKWNWSEKPTPGLSNIIELRSKDKKENIQKSKDNNKANTAARDNKQEKEKSVSLAANKKTKTTPINTGNKEFTQVDSVDLTKAQKQNDDLNMPLDASISSMLNNKHSMIIFVAITLAGFVGSISGVVFSRKIK